MHIVVACTGSKIPWEAKNSTGSQGTHSVLWKPKIFLPCSKGHTNHVRHMRKINPFHTLPFHIHFNILSLFAHRCSKSSLSYRFPWRKLFMTFLFWVFYDYISNTSHLNNILWGLEIMKLPILEFLQSLVAFFLFKS